MFQPRIRFIEWKNLDEAIEIRQEIGSYIDDNKITQEGMTRSEIIDFFIASIIKQNINLGYDYEVFV